MVACGAAAPLIVGWGAAVGSAVWAGMAAAGVVINSFEVPWKASKVCLNQGPLAACVYGIKETAQVGAAVVAGLALSAGLAVTSAALVGTCYLTAAPGALGGLLFALNYGPRAGTSR